MLDRYAAGPLTGRPSLTRRATGAGAAWYLSTLPDDDALAAVCSTRVTGAGGVSPVADVPPGVEAVRRRGAEGSWLFLVNDTDQPQEVPATGHDLVGVMAPWARPSPSLPGGVAVVRED